jgi:hypothetical protein
MISSTNDKTIDDCKNKCILNIETRSNKTKLPPITNHNASDKEKLLFISNIHKLLRINKINTNIIPNTTKNKLPNQTKDTVSNSKPITRSNIEEPNTSDEVINNINSLINQFNKTYYPNPSGGKSKSKSKTKKKNYKKKTKKRSKRKTKNKRNKRRKTYKNKKMG